MAEPCAAVHPQHEDITCIKPRTACFVVHEARRGPEKFSWPNERPRPTAATNRPRLNAARDRARARAGLSDVNTPEGSVGHDDPPTSQAAERLVAPVAGTQRHAVLAAIAAAGGHGMTDSEAAATTELWAYSVVPRRGELSRGGWVQDSGRTRPSERGGQQVVWVLTEQAQALLAELVDAPDSSPGAAMREGSTPSEGTSSATISS